MAGIVAWQVKNYEINKKWGVQGEHTTSTGDPIQTAKKPAPSPEKRCVITSSLNPGIFNIVCTPNKYY